MYKKSALIIYLLFISCVQIWGQNGVLKGVITDRHSNEGLIGAIVQIQNSEIAVESDLDGGYLLNAPAGVYTLLVSYGDTYIPDTLKNVEIVSNKILLKNLSLVPIINDMGTITFVQKVKKDDAMGTLIEKKKETGTSDNVDSKTLSKSAASNVSDGLKKVTGASIQDGKFAIIRGMSDRYNAGYINGSPLPSTEADKKAFSFDLLPTSLVDNLVVLKSGSADLTGDFGGGIIKISTKSIPDSFIVSLGLGAQYNSVTTNKSYSAFNGSNTDWLGYDNSLRKHPNLTTTLGKSNPGPLLKDYVNETQKFNNDYNINQLKAPFGSRFNFSIGAPFVKKENFQLGGIAAYNYNQTSTRTVLENNFYTLDEGQQNSYFEDTLGTMTVNNSAMINIGTKIFKKHKIEYKALNGINSSISNLSRSGASDFINSPYNTINQYATIMLFNRLRTHQFLGDHSFFKNRLKIDWNVSNTKIVKLIPDYRVVTYANIFDEENYVFNTTVSTGSDFKAGNGRFFGDLLENLKSQSVNAKFNFNKYDTVKVTSAIKFGGFRQLRTREFNSQKYVFVNAPQSNLNINNPGLDFNNENFEKNNTYLNYVNTVTDKGYVANSKLYAVYAMLENSFYNKLKISYGVRYENFNQVVNAFASESVLNKNVLLPSVNANYKLTPLKSNLRVAAYKTINRPEFREVASFAFYDFLQNADVVGNPNLKQASINNYEARYEFLPTPEQIVSVGGFYKFINNPIELRYDVTQPTFRTFTYANEIQAKVYGVELDFKKTFDFIGHKSDSNFFNCLYFTTNIALTQSRVTVDTNSTSSTDRPLQGQSPYLINFALGYDNKDNGWTITLSANKYGRRLATVGPTRDPKSKLNSNFGFDMFENPRTIIDFQIAKTIKKFTIKGTLGDLLHQDLIFYNDINKNYKYDTKDDNVIFKSKLGYTFTLSLSATI